MDDALRERVEALERAVTDGDHDLSAVADEAAALDRLDDLESRVAAAEERLDDLDAASQALRGYVGNVRAVNTDVEQRADAALAKAESLERRLDGDESGDAGSTTGAGDAAVDGQSRPQRSSAHDRHHERAGQTSRQGTATDSGEHGHPTDGGRQPSRCASCGRPHGRGGTATDGRDGAADQRATARTATPEQGEPAATGTRGTGGDRQAGPSSHAPGATAAQDAEESQATASADAVPTVASLAQRDEPSNEHGETGPDQLPDGTDDPLVGATDEAANTGTLERIRDLL